MKFRNGTGIAIMLKTYTTDKGGRTTNILIDHIHILPAAYFLARPLKLVQTSLKVKRSGGYAVSGGIFLCMQRVSPRKPFPFHVCTMDADGKLRSLQKINPFFRPPANIRPCPAELLLSSFAVFMLKILKYNVSQVI